MPKLCDILSNFQTMCLTVYVFRNIFNDILKIYFQTLFLIMLKLCRKKGPDPNKNKCRCFSLQCFFWPSILLLLRRGGPSFLQQCCYVFYRPTKCFLETFSASIFFALTFKNVQKQIILTGLHCSDKLECSAAPSINLHQFDKECHVCGFEAIHTAQSTRSSEISLSSNQQCFAQQAAQNLG